MDDFPALYGRLKQEKSLTRGDGIYPSNIMAWIGCIMTYFSCLTPISLKAFYKKDKLDDLRSLYEAYHSLGPELAIKRICDASGISLELNDVELYKLIVSSGFKAKKIRPRK